MGGSSTAGPSAVLREAREDEAAWRPLWRSGSGKRRAPSAASRRLAEQLFVAPRLLTLDHGRLMALVRMMPRADPSKADVSVTWRDAMQLRLCPNCCATSWTRQLEGTVRLSDWRQTLQPPHLDELQERGSYQERFGLGSGRRCGPLSASRNCRG